jgi:hypothetical protein
MGPHRTFVKGDLLRRRKLGAVQLLVIAAMWSWQRTGRPTRVGLLGSLGVERGWPLRSGAGECVAQQQRVAWVIGGVGVQGKPRSRQPVAGMIVEDAGVHRLVDQPEQLGVAGDWRVVAGS